MWKRGAMKLFLRRLLLLHRNNNENKTTCHDCRIGEWTLLLSDIPSSFIRAQERRINEANDSVRGRGKCQNERRGKKYRRSTDVFFDRSKMRMAWCVGTLAHLYCFRCYQHDKERGCARQTGRKSAELEFDEYKNKKKENSPIHRCLQSLAKLVIIIIVIINSQVLPRKEEDDDDDDEDKRE